MPCPALPCPAYPGSARVHRYIPSSLPTPEHTSTPHTTRTTHTRTTHTPCHHSTAHPELARVRKLAAGMSTHPPVSVSGSTAHSWPNRVHGSMGALPPPPSVALSLHLPPPPLYLQVCRQEPRTLVVWRTRETATGRANPSYPPVRATSHAKPKRPNQPTSQPANQTSNRPFSQPCLG